VLQPFDQWNAGCVFLDQYRMRSVSRSELNDRGLEINEIDFLPPHVDQVVLISVAHQKYEADRIGAGFPGRHCGVD
jgi:hypothetical protein